MKLISDELQALARVAVDAATEAGEMIAGSRPAEIEHKPDEASLSAQVVTEVDRRSEAIILRHLTPTLDRFGLGLLTEESADDGGRLVADHFWCVDPLDGTLPFIEGRPGYAVSIALVGRDGTPQIGVVVDPVESTLWCAVAGAGIFQNGERWEAATSASGASLSLFADRSLVADPHHDAALAALGSLAGERGHDAVRTLVGPGAVLNACGVLSNAPACYVKYPTGIGGGSLWDFAATACLFREAGYVVSDIHGGALDLNRVGSTAMNHRGVLFSTDAAIAERLRAVIGTPLS